MYFRGGKRSRRRFQLQKFPQQLLPIPVELTKGIGQARGQQQQVFRTDKPAEMLALVLYTYLLGFESYNTAHHINAQGKFMPDEKIVEYVDFLMEMLQS